MRSALLCLALIAAPAMAQDEKPAVYRSQDIAWHNTQQAYLAALTRADGWRYLPGGLKWRRTAGDGSGARPTIEDVVTVHYAGTFTDGTSFDSSFDRGEPATFPLGRLIKAWQLAIPEMGVGDTIELAAPALLAYGPSGKGPIPGGATLLFKVQLLAIGDGSAGS
jgi:FKBP-type peptidyl-prolyl cis-trans isomerase FkpA